MSDVKPEPTAKVIEDAVVVEDAPPARVEVVETIDAAVPVEPVVTQQVVYLHTPPEPGKKGNRGVGAAIAVASGVIFTAALALVTATIGAFGNGRFSFTFLASPQFYIPTLFFVVAFVLLVLVANRASWWAYIFGSIVVALVVYFGTIGALLLANGVIMTTPDEAAALFAAGLVDPIVVAATLLAREVSLWTGSIIARRGRKVKVRNGESRAAWEREVAEKRAAHEQAASAASAAN